MIAPVRPDVRKREICVSSAQELGADVTLVGEYSSP